MPDPKKDPFDKPEDIVELLKEKQLVLGDKYRRVAGQRKGTVEADEVTDARVVWLNARLELARELKKEQSLWARITHWLFG